MRRLLIALLSVTSIVSAQAQFLTPGVAISGGASIAYIPGAVHLESGVGLHATQVSTTANCKATIAYARRGWPTNDGYSQITADSTSELWGVLTPSDESAASPVSFGNLEGLTDIVGGVNNWRFNMSPNGFGANDQVASQATTAPGVAGIVNAGLWHHFLETVNTCSGSGKIAMMLYIDGVYINGIYGFPAGTLPWSNAPGGVTGNYTGGWQINESFGPGAAKLTPGEWSDFLAWDNVDLVSKCTGVGTPVAQCTGAWSGNCAATTCYIASTDLANFVGSGTPANGTNFIPVDPTKTGGAIDAYGAPTINFSGCAVQGCSDPHSRYWLASTGVPNNQGNSQTSQGGSAFAIRSGEVNTTSPQAGVSLTNAIGVVTGSSVSAGVCTVSYTSGITPLPVGAAVWINSATNSQWSGLWTVTASTSGSPNTVSFNCPNVTGTMDVAITGGSCPAFSALTVSSGSYSLPTLTLNVTNTGSPAITAGEWVTLTGVGLLSSSTYFQVATASSTQLTFTDTGNPGAVSGGTVNAGSIQTLNASSLGYFTNNYILSGTVQVIGAVAGVGTINGTYTNVLTAGNSATSVLFPVPSGCATNAWGSGGTILSGKVLNVTGNYTGGIGSSGAVDTSNVATITFTGGQPYIPVGGTVNVQGVSPSCFNGLWTVTAQTNGTVSYSDPACNGQSGGNGWIAQQVISDAEVGPAGSQPHVPGLKWTCAHVGTPDAPFNAVTAGNITGASWSGQVLTLTNVSNASYPHANTAVTLSGFSTTGASINGTFYVTAGSATSLSLYVPSNPGTITYSSGAYAGQTAYTFPIHSCAGEGADNPTNTTIPASIQTGDLIVVIAQEIFNSTGSNSCSTVGNWTTASVTATGFYGDIFGTFYGAWCVYYWTANGTEQWPFVAAGTTSATASYQVAVLDYGPGAQIDTAATGSGIQGQFVASNSNTIAAPGVTTGADNDIVLAAYFAYRENNGSGQTTGMGGCGGTSTSGQMATRLDQARSVGQGNSNPLFLICDTKIPASGTSVTSPGSSTINGAVQIARPSAGLTIAIAPQ